MNREDIIRMAREAFIDEELPNVDVTYKSAWFSCTAEELERFAAIVAAAEREACAQVCEAGVHNAEDWDSSYWDQCCNNRAAAIRARGNT